jgi:hypothetical protein
VNSLLVHSVAYGLLVSFLSSVVLLVSAFINPESMVAGYPPDIQAKHGPISAQAQRHKKLVGLPFGLVLIGLLIISIITLDEVTFLRVFVNSAVILMMFNLVDLIVIDWLIFNTLQPKFIILPGTEGMAGYLDYGFHFRQFLKGTAGSLAASLLIAAITMLVMRFWS